MPARRTPIWKNRTSRPEAGAIQSRRLIGHRVCTGRIQKPDSYFSWLILNGVPLRNSSGPRPIFPDNSLLFPVPDQPGLGRLALSAWR